MDHHDLHVKGIAVNPSLAAAVDPVDRLLTSPRAFAARAVLAPIDVGDVLVAQRTGWAHPNVSDVDHGGPFDGDRR